MSLQIKLPKLYYAAGEPVSGNVALTLKKARKFNYITITYDFGLIGLIS